MECCGPDNFELSFIIWDRFLSLAWSKLRLCSANHRAGYFRNLACDWLSIVWAYSEQETENGPRTFDWHSWHETDAFTVSVALPWRQTFVCHEGMCKGTVSGLWKIMDVPTSHFSLECITTEAFPNLHSDQPITNELCQPFRGHISYPLTVLQRPGWDCVSV